MKRRSVTSFWILLLLLSYTANAQVQKDSIRRALTNPQPGIAASAFLQAAKQFYEMDGYKFRWMNDSLVELTQLSRIAAALPSVGLSVADYMSCLPSCLISQTDSTQAEIGLTIAALGMIHDLAYGRKEGIVSFDGLQKFRIDSTAALLNRMLAEGSLRDLPGSLEPPVIEYVNMRTMLRQLLENIADGHAADSRVKQSLELRIADLSAALNAFRWAYSQFGMGHGVIVNIPSAELYYFENSKTVMVSRIIAGKQSTPTPTLGSMIDQVVLYPYWHVPRSIATRDLLPLIKKDPGFINRGNYQLLDSKGRVIDPLTVKWASINAQNFPFVLRQSTGCDNALGWIKLNFNNPYSVYLHDTPGKLLFNLSKRYFSHGCMRVQKASELARRVLGDNTALIDSLEKIGPLRNVSPYPIGLGKPVPVIVLYQLAWFDSNGEIRFYEDVYRKRVTKR